MIPGSYRRFIRSWLDDPFAVGALAPSGRPLAKMMTREVGPDSRVLELGPGTGTLTREILARGVVESNLTVIERCSGFADLLEQRFPAATVLRGDATRPHEQLASKHGHIDVVISGLPLMLFSRDQKFRLLDECFQLLTEAGAFFQFTYGVRCPVDRRYFASRGLVARCVGFIALNMPPAFVYRISRAQAVR
jgi:phosphatidylethanolamine/phosphatidyl-N-methylethanolamine N-methyltransferase